MTGHPAGEIVVDAQCFCQLYRMPESEGILLTTPQVAAEAKSLEAGIRLRQSGVRIIAPSRASVKKAESLAEKNGETGLSAADISIIALALERGACVATDDYALQNVCAKADVRFRPVCQDGIAGTRDYAWKCEGCGRIFRQETGTCPECGHRVRRTISHRGKNQ